MKPIFCWLLSLLTITPASSQIIQNLKKGAENEARKIGSKENLQKVGNLVLKDLEKARAQFDSTDFDYAILVSDNSGLFDVKEKGEGTSKVATWTSLGSSFYKNESLTDGERARFNLEMGELAFASGRYTYAESRFGSAKGFYEKGRLTNDIGYLKTIASQGLLYATMGRFTQAESSTAEALSLRREKLGATNPGVASSLNNYGVLHYNLARYYEAEQSLTESLSILQANQAQGAMPYAIVLNNQAMLQQTVGRFDEAEQTLKRAIAIAEKLQNSKSRSHLKFMSNLALLYQQVGRYGDAEALYLSMEKRLGRNDPDYASMLINLAALYVTTGKDDKVEEPLKKAATIYKASFGEENPPYARAISDLGNFYRYKARYAEAQPLLDRALAIRDKTLGHNHPHYVQSKEDIAILFWKKEEWNHAYMTYRDVMEKTVDFINRYFPPMSEAEKTKYWDLLYPRFQRFKNFAIDCHFENKHILKDLHDYELTTKALLLNSTNKIKNAILDSKDQELIKDYFIWLDQKERLARLYAYSKNELKEQKINLDSMERAANGMERKLSERSSEFSSGYGVQKVSHTHVQQLLGDTEALVEIIRVRSFDQSFTREVKYIVLVLGRHDETSKMVVLKNGQELETRYAKFYQNAIQQRIDDRHSFEQFWAPIEADLKGKRMVYLSPDGVYNQLNLNTIKRPGGDHVINHFDLVILGNARDLIEIKKRKPITARKSATLIGFPEYGGTSVAPLPGTKTEVEGISKVLKASSYQTAVHMQTSATEAVVKAVRSPTLLHIATHGYFLEDVGEIDGSAYGVHVENANNNPLLRSGLLLAGAGNTAAGAMPDLSSNDNGVLTAYEAMSLNLEETDLVVLSACETGLGDVKAGEGVYGLQRAFQVAGAEAIIMSLWRVDDAATQLLMTNFYSNWIKVRNKQKAFKQAQLQLMAKYKDPYYWGAFVMVGM